jgi:Peptidase family C25
MTRWWLFFAVAFFPVRGLAEDTPPQWVVVTAPAFRSAIEPLCTHRKAQGMHVLVVQTTDVLTPKEILAGAAQKLRERVNALCRGSRGPSYVLLVGALDAVGLDEAEKKVLPPLPGTTGRMKGQPSDNGYGCLGKELLPEVAVGRFPARSEDEARMMVQKTLAYEKDNRPGEWRRTFTLLAGMPGFNATLDALVERVAIAQFSRIDPSWRGHVIYYQPQSRFCVPDGALHDRALQYVGAGQALTLYLGHSYAGGFYSGRAHYLDRDDWATLKIARGPGVFVTFGCNGCQLRGADGASYGVAAFRNPGGPVAVIGSHAICFAAMNELAAHGFCESFLGAEPPERLGACWLRMKASLATKALPFYFALLDAADGDPHIPAATQRLEHLEMFLLLGDPALKLPALPRDVKLAVAGTAGPGNILTIQGQVPPRLAGAQVRLTVERPTTSEPADLVPLPKLPGGAQAQIMLDNHERANTFVLATAKATVAGGRFEGHLQLPARLPWSQLTVRAYVHTPRQEGLAIQVVPVKVP